jgi:uncharacterized membrane protein YeiH
MYWMIFVQPTIVGGIELPSIGGIAFAIAGCRNVLNFKNDKDGPRWLAYLLNWLRRSLSFNDKRITVITWFVFIIFSVVCGISLFCFGGGLIRDLLIFGVEPWFVKEMHQLAIITAIVLLYIPVHEHFKENLKWIELRNFAYFALVFCDVCGLFEFAQIGHRKATTLISEEHTLYYLYIFAAALATQIGGGLCAITIRCDFFNVRKNIGYYCFALAMNIAIFIGDSSSLFILFLLSIVAGFLVDSTTSEKMKSSVTLIWYYLWDNQMEKTIQNSYIGSILRIVVNLYIFMFISRISSTREEIQLICRHVKTMDICQATNNSCSYVKQKKQSKPFYPNIHDNRWREKVI